MPWTTKKALLSIAVVITAAFATGYELHNYLGANIAHANSTPVAASLSITGRGLPDFTNIVASQGPAVVNISVTGSKTKSFIQRFPGFPGFPDDDEDNPFKDFFPRFNGPMPRDVEPVRGLGSGFIVSPDGVILTNAHVVAGAKEVTVKLTDKREFQAKVVGVDKPSDVAVLRISGSNLPVVRIGDASRTKVGEWVLAIGSPFGFENSATAGIVSAKSRSLPDEGYVPFLQTDVAINPGNSGGPLFNAEGEVIGINSQIFSRSGGYQGLSFAIPIDIAMKVEKQLLEHGKVNHGRLGVTIQEVNQQLADSFGLDKPKGALVSSVEKDSPADKAGIKAGDVILQFNNVEIGRSTDLPPLVADLNPGTAANLSFWRNGKKMDASVTVGTMTVAGTGEEIASDASNQKLGLVVRPLTAAEKAQSHLDHGLIVVDVSGPAEHAGVRPGDIVVAANGKPINAIEDLRSAIKAAGKHIALLISRDGQQRYMPLDLG